MANIVESLQKEILVFDGGMGTMLQARGLQAGELPELLNLSHPDVVADIHREYVRAGADVVTTNTFGANRLKLEPAGQTVDEMVTAAVRLAKSSGARFVALDMGPTGQLLQPMGTLPFEDAYELYREQAVAGEQAGADLVIIETVADPQEAKAAILAVKENTSLPVFCTLTYQEDGRTFTGTDPVTGTVILQSLGVDALGVNCSVGPLQLRPIVRQILAHTDLPVLVQANAGLPQMRDGKTVFDVGPDAFAEQVGGMIQEGVSVVGGCCGTTPAHIQKLRQLADASKPQKRPPVSFTAVASGVQTVFLDRGVHVIGERINPTGKKRMKQALRENKLDVIVGEAIDQQNAGADILDINAGLPELDEPAMVEKVVRLAQSVTSLPVQVDSSEPAAIERGVRAANGRPMINSVNGKQENMRAIFPIAKKYGAVVVGLTLDEKGIPKKAEERFAIAQRIVRTAAEYGIPARDIVIDCLTLTASAQQAEVIETIRAISLVRQRLGVCTTLGVSNVSFGLPARPLLNSVFLAAAFGAGLTTPILNPLSAEMMRAVDAFRVVNNQDRDAAAYIQKYADTQADAPAQAGTLALKDLIIQGRKEQAAQATATLLETTDPLQLIDEQFIPALDKVGADYEAGRLFLPQLMQSAEATKASFEVIKTSTKAEERPASKGKIVIATVHGDIHDIGKNIVKMLLENYGFDVIDLGKDVPAETVAQAVKETGAPLVGLSALMTTTVKSMKETIALLHEQRLPCKVFVGGAVLNEEYAGFVGADYYADDARESVRIAQSLFGQA